MGSGDALRNKLSTLVVEEDRPDIGQLPDNVRADRRAGCKLREADLLGEELCGVESATSKPEKKEEECLIRVSRELSCSHRSEQKGEEGEAAVCSEPVEGPPDGFVFILPHVDLLSLLTLERVSKPMRSGVNDVLVWSKLRVEPPLSRNLTNDIFFSLVKRAKGTLKCLSLIECFRITDEAVRHALSLSPRLEKLFIPGCTGLSAEGIVNMVQQHAEETRAKGMPGIKQLRVRGIYNMTQQHLDAFRAVVLAGSENQARHTKPVYWNEDPMSILEDERAIDVEICPRCKSDSPTLVFDCTRESCRNLGRLEPSKACRGCIMCLPRCVGCGACLPKDEEWDKTCCTDWVCLTCWLHLPKCAECQNAFCRKHKSTFSYNEPDGARICEDCRIYGSCDDISEEEPA